jgi:cyclic pyranopterin monophosphate synthase
MVDVGHKKTTRRLAVASGALVMGRAAFNLLKAGKLPKGDALALGEIAGVLAAKNASATIPLCHPLPLDRVHVSFSLDAKLPGVRAGCECATAAKTGVEMEALAGVTGALLAVYDLVKQVDPKLTITDVRLDRKEGGKSGVYVRGAAKAAPSRPKMGPAAVITVSDRCFQKKSVDTSGPALAAGLKAMGFSAAKPVLVPDSADAIAKAVVKLSKSARLVALTGGTGLSPRDVTPETVAPLCDRPVPGIAEALRDYGARNFPSAVLSRSFAGQRGRCLIVCLPGSRGGVEDGLAVLKDLLPHALHVIDGGGH